MIELPIDPFVPRLVALLGAHRAVVVTAQPGAGKTTRVPPALVGDGPVILLQPRRAAARAVALRIAQERGWTPGREVGWQMRLDRRFCRDTRLLVATEGVLTARLQQDPLLSSFHTVVLDEFHERSVHADLALALAKQAWRARADLRIVVMSATLDAAAAASFLDGCPVVEVPGRTYPVEISYAPGRPVADAAVDLLWQSGGDVLCFLPGALEIRRAIADIEARMPDGAADLVPLHGSLDGDAQDRALAPVGPRRRIIVATNIAETSVTVPGVAAVVDSGLHKLARYDAERGIDSLVVERIPRDAADQRAGRAGRVGPGMVVRLWEARDRLRPHREPEIHRIDLSGVALDVIGWGGSPLALEWFDPPREDRLRLGIALLERLGAVRDGALTDIGRRMQRLPLHPRLARMLVASGGSTPMARACALLSERHDWRPRLATTSSDLLSAVDEWTAVPPHVQRVASEIERLARGEAGSDRTSFDASPDERFRRAVLAGYPDRVAQRRAQGSSRVKLASGAGAAIATQSGVRTGEFLVALDVVARPRRGSGTDGDDVVRLASRIERDWLEPTAREITHRLDDATGTIRALEIARYDELVLDQRPVPLDPAVATGLLAGAWLARGPGAEDTLLLRRLAFCGIAIDLTAMVHAVAREARSLDAISLRRALTPGMIRALDRDAPEALRVPSGRGVRLEYTEDGGVTAAVKLQELFGLSDTPRLGARRVPVLLALLAPNGRPVQMTRDLRGFWERTYPEVRKELRGRYPRHPWPEDPRSAAPTARTARPGR